MSFARDYGVIGFGGFASHAVPVRSVSRGASSPPVHVLRVWRVASLISLAFTKPRLKAVAREPLVDNDAGECTLQSVGSPTDVRVSKSMFASLYASVHGSADEQTDSAHGAQFAFVTSPQESKDGLTPSPVADATTSAPVHGVSAPADPSDWQPDPAQLATQIRRNCAALLACMDTQEAMSTISGEVEGWPRVPFVGECAAPLSALCGVKGAAGDTALCAVIDRYVMFTMAAA